MTVTEILMQEHRVIEQVLTCLEKMASESSRTGVLPTAEAREAIDFFRVFADQCHHAKEENLLFPAMEQRGFSSAMGPTAVMRHEHEDGRRCIRSMKQAVDEYDAGDATAAARFRTAAQEYCNLLRAHIQKEDHCLFPMANMALSDADRARLLAGFDRIEHDDVPAGAHEKFLKIAEQLAKRFGAPMVKLQGATCGHGCSQHGTAAPAKEACSHQH